MKPITRVSVTDQIVERIKSQIYDGTYKKGDKLPSELELCKELQVGRSAVREAYRVLQASGYIEIIHGRGAFVLNEDAHFKNEAQNWFLQNNYNLKDVWVVRHTIENAAVKLAVTGINDKEIQLLEKIQDSFAEAVIQYKVNQMALYDEYFHSYIVEISHNPLLISIYNSISDILRAYRLNSYSLSSSRYYAITLHQELIDALKARDSERAIKAVEHHINVSTENIDNIVVNALDTTK